MREKRKEIEKHLSILNIASRGGKNPIDELESTYRFGPYTMLKASSGVIVQAGCINVLNLLSVRCQNIDYKHHKSLLLASIDTLKVDRHRIFYKGLYPSMLGMSILYVTVDFMNVLRHPSSLASHFLWPLIFGVGTAIAHPCFVLSVRVMTSQHHRNNRSHLNTFTAALELSRQGISGYYRGYVPALFIYTAYHFNALYQGAKDTYEVYQQERAI
jgi:hypothetical protein